MVSRRHVQKSVLSSILLPIGGCLSSETSSNNHSIELAVHNTSSHRSDIIVKLISDSNVFFEKKYNLERMEAKEGVRVHNVPDVVSVETSTCKENRRQYEHPTDETLDWIGVYYGDDCDIEIGFS